MWWNNKIKKTCKRESNTEKLFFKSYYVLKVKVSMDYWLNLQRQFSTKIKEIKS